MTCTSSLSQSVQLEYEIDYTEQGQKQRHQGGGYHDSHYGNQAPHQGGYYNYNEYVPNKFTVVCTCIEMVKLIVNFQLC